MSKNKKPMWLEREIINSPALRSLGKWSLLVCLDFLYKRQMEKKIRNRRANDWIIKNNGEIVYPYSEAQKKGIGPREFRNAIDELIEKGFLDITHHGSGGRSGDMTRYYIDDRWKEYGSPQFRSAKKPRPKDTRKGRGWEAYHTKKKNKQGITKLILKKAVSNNNIVNPDGGSMKLSSNISDTLKVRVSSLTTCNNLTKHARSQKGLE